MCGITTAHDDLGFLSASWNQGTASKLCGVLFYRTHFLFLSFCLVLSVQFINKIQIKYTSFKAEWSLASRQSARRWMRDTAASKLLRRIRSSSVRQESALMLSCSLWARSRRRISSCWKSFSAQQNNKQQKFHNFEWQLLPVHTLSNDINQTACEILAM